MFNVNNTININNEMNQSTKSPSLSPQNKLFGKFISYSVQTMNADPQMDLATSCSETNGSKVQTTTKPTSSNLLFNFKTNEQNSLFNSFKSNQSTSDLFQLSEPTSNIHTIKSTHNKSTLPSSSLVFTFNEPSRLNPTKSIKSNDETPNDQSKFIEQNDIFETNTFSNESLSHLNNKPLNNTNNNPNIFVINSVRAHPYQPTSRIYTTTGTNDNSESFISSGNSSLQNRNESVNYSNANGTINENSNESNINQNNSFTDNNLNNGNKSSKISITKSNQLVFAGRVNSSSGSNAILAHLKSLGPSLRSIFVRPKNCKLIDSATIFKKLTKESLITGATSNSSTTDDKQQSTANGNKKSLFSRFYDDEEEYQSLFKKSSPNAKSLLTNPLLNIRPKEMCLNASVDDLFKRCENDFDHSNVFNSNYTSMTITPNKYNDSKHALVKATSSSSSTSSSSFNSNYPTQTIHEKWTCLVCLSKHLLNVNICSVCGSSKQSTSTKLSSSSIISFTKGYSTSSNSSTPSFLCSKSSFSSEKQQQQQNQSNSSILNQKDSKRYNAVKCWTCVHCKYSNDNLKIVCMNCRNLKTTPQISRKLSEKFDLNEMSPQKRKISENENEKIENDETNNAKTSKPNDNQNSNDKTCENCRTTSELNTKQTSDDTKPKENFTTISNQSKEKEQLTFNTSLSETFKSSEKSEPIGFFKIKPANSEPKWNCNTCLASNPESIDKCACCATSKPSKTSMPSSLQTTIANETKKVEEKPTESLSSLFKTNASSKWTCSTCMVSNENDKTSCVCCNTPKSSDNSTNRNEPSKLLSTINSSPFAKLAAPETVSKTTSSGFKFGMSASESTNGPIKFGTSSFLATATSSSKSETNAQQTQSTFSFSSNPITIKPNEPIDDAKTTSSPFKTTDVELKSPEKTSQPTLSLSKPLFSNVSTTIPPLNSNLFNPTTNTQTSLATNSTEKKAKESENPTTSTISSTSLFKFGASSVTSPTPNQSSITITKLSENANSNESNKLLSNATSDSNMLMTPFKFGVPSSTVLTPSTASTTPNSFQSPVINQSQQPSQPTTQPQTKPFSLFQSTFGKDSQSSDLFKPSNEVSDSNAKPTFSLNNTSTVPNFSLPNFSLTPTPTPTQSTSFSSIANSTTNPLASTQSTFNTPILQTNKPFGTLNSSDSLKPNQSSFGFNIFAGNPSVLSNTPTTTNTTNNPSETSLNSLLQQPPKTTSTFTFGSIGNNTTSPTISSSINTQPNQSSIFSSQQQTNNSFSFKPSVPTFGSNTTSTAFNSNNTNHGTNAFSLPFNSNTSYKFNETPATTTLTFGSAATNAFNFQSNPVTNFTSSIPASFNFTNTNTQAPGGVFQFGRGGEDNQSSESNGKRPFRKAIRRHR